jgi:hypothetical protein
MPGTTLGTRAVVTVVLVGLIGGLIALAAGVFLARSDTPRFRAELELAVVPGPTVPPEQLPVLWEVLATGQAPRIVAEVLGQQQWLTPAAEAAKVDEDTLRITAGVVPGTTLVVVGGEAQTAHAAETAVTAVVSAATSLAQSASGPFVLQVLQSAQGTAMSQATPDWQVITVSGLAGLIAGAGGALLFVGRRDGGGRPGAGNRGAGPSRRPGAGHDTHAERPPLVLQPGPAPFTRWQA